ncbi:MAG: hypothetical protein IJV04_02125 [Lachnospiraceae bacterium]|nr:hypothetical protein [Lachnospiraceae bacterium]
MNNNKNKAIWYLFTTMLSIFNICTIQIFDGFNWPFYAVTINALVSLCGLIFQVHVEETVQRQFKMIAVRTLLFMNSVSVFAMIGLSLFILTSQYHNHLKSDKTISSSSEIDPLLSQTGKDVLLLETDDLYIYYADYQDLSYEAGKRPSKNDPDSLMCVAAAFQSSYQLGFSHDNIVGWHTSDGQLYQGKPQENLGAFTYIYGTARIWDTEDAKEAIHNAAAQNGIGFQQFIVLYDGKRGSHGSDEFRCYRVLSILNDKLCVIDSRTQMHYDDYIRALQELGVKDALYCDMGSGWNYSWYRAEDGRPVNIIGTPWPFSHNWLVFRR